MATFAERLKALRKSKGQTQKQMGEFLGLTERTFRQYEAGEVDPPSSKAIKLADYFGVSLDYLMGRTNYSVDADGHITAKVPSDLFGSDAASGENGSGKE